MRLLNTPSALSTQVIEALCLTELSQSGRIFSLTEREKFGSYIAYPSLYLFLSALFDPWRDGATEQGGSEGGAGQGEDPQHPLHLLHSLLVSSLRRHSPQLELELGVRQELHSSRCQLQNILRFL